MARVVGVQDALDEDRQRGVLAQPREVLPGQRRVREDLRPLPDGGGGVVLRRRGQARPEDRVGGVVRQALAEQEGQVGAGQVLRPPRHEAGVERDDDRGVARRLRPADQADHELGVVRPVELEPARRVAGRRGDVLQARRRGGAEHHAGARRRGRPRDRQLPLRVDDREDADRAEQHGRVQPRPEHVRAPVAHGDVGEHPRHERPAVEGGAVGGDRAALARAAGGVGPRLGRELRARPRLELVVLERDDRRLTAQAAAVDLELVGPQGHRGDVPERSRGLLGVGHGPSMASAARPFKARVGAGRGSGVTADAAGARDAQPSGVRGA